MASYYIKEVYPPIPAHSLNEGEECNIHFTEQSEQYCKRFAEADAFLVYATGRTEEGKSIFARGEIRTIMCRNVWDEDPREVDGVKFPLGVKVYIEKRVDPSKGVPLSEIRRLLPNLYIGQAHGGLIEIDADEFKVLSEALDKCA